MIYRDFFKKIFTARSFFHLLFLIIFSFFFSPEISVAQDSNENPATIKSALVKNIALDGNLVKIELLKKPDFNAFTLKNPPRLVIDVKNSYLPKDFKNPKLSDFIANFRFNYNREVLRLVFEFKEDVEKVKITSLAFDDIKNLIACNFELEKSSPAEITPNYSPAYSSTVQSSQELGQILANDDLSKLIDKIGNKGKKIAIANENGSITEIDKNSARRYKIRSDKQENYSTRKIPSIESESAVTKKTEYKPIIVIDAGHGGKDPGTTGIFAHSKEKNITLAYSRELAKQLLQTKNYRVFLTRNSDKFIPLKERVERARRKKADLFISLHANAIEDESISGFSIYTLSEKSSDKQAEMLANKENQADIINGLNFSGSSPEVMKTLIDLAQRDSKNNSAKFAESVIEVLKNQKFKILQNSHRFAGFMVLTAPDMASVLIELGYLSNQKEEKLLNSLTYRRQIAKNLQYAIDDYFQHYQD